MALDRRRKNRQRAMLVATDRILAPGHPFYRAPGCQGTAAIGEGRRGVGSVWRGTPGQGAPRPHGPITEPEAVEDERKMEGTSSCWTIFPIFIVLALLGLGFREEMTEIAFDGGVHSSHPWNDPAYIV